MATGSDITNIYDRFKKAQFDLDFGEDITRQYFTDYFKNNNIDEQVTQTVYNSIPKQNNDYLTTKEFFDWQREQCTKRVIQDLISNNDSNKQDNESSKSYEIKFDLYEDENNENNNATQETQETQETKEAPIKDTTTKQSTESENDTTQDNEWSKSYEIKFDLYEENEDNETEQKQNNTEIIYADSPEEQNIKTPNKISVKPPMKNQVSAVFKDYIEAQTPQNKINIKFSPKTDKQSTPLSIGIGTSFPTTPSKSNTNKSPKSKSMNRVDKFLMDDSDDSDDSDDIIVDKDIENEIKKQNKFRCMECICFLLFLLLFTGMAIFSIGSGDSNYTATTSIRKPLIDVGEFIGWNDISEKTFIDISTVEDIYHYMRQVLLPFLLSDERRINNSEIYYIQNHHILLGGIRMRQVRQEPLICNVCENVLLSGECNDDKSMLFNESDCYEYNKIDRQSVVFYSKNDSSMENITYEYMDSSILLDQRYQGKFESYPGGGYIQDLPLNLLDSFEIIEMLEDIDWIDGSSLCLFIDWTTYSPSKSLHTLSRLVFEMPTSGIFVTDEIKTWKFDRYSNDISGFILFLIHIIFILFVFVISGVFVIDIYRNYCDKQKNNNETRFCNQWRILDILNLIIFYITIGLFIHNESYQKSLINIYKFSGPYQSFRRLQGLSLIEQFCFASNGFLLWIKLFKYLSFHPKFKFLFFMLKRGLQDIVMFIVLLFVFYLAFALSGFIIFSSDVSEYRTYGLSIISMNLFMLTQMNYNSLIASSRSFGSFYYFCWLIWMTFILINVFIAILIDSYAKTQVEIELNNTNQMRFNVFDKGRQYIKKLKLAQLMSRFDAIDKDGDDNVDVNEIMDALQINYDDAKKVMIKYDKDGNGVLDRKEFEKLKQKMIRDKMEVDSKGNSYNNNNIVNKHENLNQQVDDMEELLNQVLKIDPVGKRALKQRQGLLKRKESSYKD